MILAWQLIDFVIITYERKSHIYIDTNLSVKHLNVIGPKGITGYSHVSYC